MEDLFIVIRYFSIECPNLLTFAATHRFDHWYFAMAAPSIIIKRKLVSFIINPN